MNRQTDKTVFSADKRPNREQPTGRYAPDMATLCYCGHTLGNHIGEGPIASRDCCESGCGCHGFAQAKR
jgi:hypothetical protein